MREEELLTLRSVPAQVVSLWVVVKGLPGLSAAGSDWRNFVAPFDLLSP